MTDHDLDFCWELEVDDVDPERDLFMIDQLRSRAVIPASEMSAHDRLLHLAITSPNVSIMDISTGEILKGR